MKKCKKCGKLKPLIEFYKNYKSKDGYLNHCKECQNTWFKKNPDYSKKWRKENPDYSKKWRKKIKDKYGLGVGTVSRFGFKLSLEVYEKCKKKCEICGCENDLTIHHKDGKGRNYENRGLEPNNSLDNLIVLCRSCHGSLHGKKYWDKKGRLNIKSCLVAREYYWKNKEKIKKQRIANKLKLK